MAKGNSNSLNNKSRSSKPYDATNSFVKQVKDRMSSYLPRFALFSPPIAVEETSNALPPNTNLRESSSEDDETASERFAPPKKRAKSELNQPPQLENFATHTLNNHQPPALDFIDGSIAGPSGISRRPCLASSTPAVRYPLESNYEIHPLANGDNDSNSSMSTSGCSSLIPQAKYQAENNKSSTSVNNRSSQRHGFGERDMSTFLQTSRSMLDGSGTRATSAASSRRPSFNASVFSAPSPGVAESAASVGRSPFYAGRTQFGGASSYRRPRGPLFAPLNAGSPAARQTVQVKPLAGASALDWGSCTARKILDTLDHLSSPVLDAKRIPSSPVLGQKRSRPAHDASPAPAREGPPTDNLTIPTVQDLLKMQRQNQMRDSMEAARKVALSPALNPTPTLTEVEKEYRSRLVADRERPAGGKMTSRMRALEDEMKPSEPLLPNVSLTLEVLPNFEADPPTKKVPTKPPRFTFVKPTPLNAEEFSLKFLKAQAAAKKKAKMNNNSANVKSKVTATPAAAPAAQFTTFSTSVKPREKSGFAEASKAAAQNGKIGFAAAAELRTGSVMDVLGKKLGPTPSSELSGFGARFKLAAGSWTCDTCLVSNASTAAKCVSCTTARPLAKTTLSQGFGEQFKPPVGSWSCDSCMVQNKVEATSCASCTTPRPPTKVTPVGFGTQFKPPVGSWTCEACMVQNKAEMGSCVSCKTAKTPAIATSAPLDPLKPVSGFGSQFKAAAGSWECDSCMVRNNSDVSACVSCSTARPASQSAAGPPTVSAISPPLGFGTQFAPPAATWECPSCLVRNGNDSVACIACETRKPVARGFMANPAAGKFDLTCGFGKNPASAANASGFTAGFGTAPPAAANASGLTASFGTAPPASKVSGFGDAFKKAEGAWDCDACMLRNTSGDKCAACEAARPGSKPADSKPAPLATAAPMFAFGVDKAGVDAKAVPVVTGSFSFGAPAPAVASSFSFGIPAKTAPEATNPAVAPASQEAAGSIDRKRKGEYEVDGPVSKTPSAASESAGALTFSAPKTNGPVAAPENNLFAFGPTAAKQGSGFGAIAAKQGSGFGTTSQSANLFSATNNSASSGLFKATTNSTAPTTDMFTKTTSSFTPTNNFFAMGSSEKPSTNLFATTESTTPTTNFFATTAVTTAPATGPFTTATSSAPSAVFTFGMTTQSKPAPVPDSAAKVVTFGSGFGVPKPQGCFSAQSTPSIGFPVTNASAPTAGFGGLAAKTEAPSFPAASFVFGQAAKPAEKAFAGFFQPTESKSFNFPATPAPNASAGFGFTAPAPAAPTTFPFSATPALGQAPAPAGAFAFGQPTTFNPSAQAKFNFTGGEVPQFTAAGVANPSTAGPRRIIKKAVRRTPR